MGLRWSSHVSTAPSSLDTGAHTLSFLSTRLGWGGPLHAPFKPALQATREEQT